MSRISGWGRAAFVGVLMAVSGAAAQAADEQMPVRRTAPAMLGGDARVIVKFKASASALRVAPLDASTRSVAALEAALQSRASALGARTGRSLSSGRALSERSQLVLSAGVDSETLAAQLRADDEVEYAEVDHFRTVLAVPNDPLYGPTSGSSPSTGQWYLKAPTSSVTASINAPAAWDITTGLSSIVVAVLDTGVRSDHPDLSGRFLPGYDMIAVSAVANDGGARDADASDPGDYVTTTDAQGTTFADCTVEDSSWHGTQVSGLIGAIANNGIGMTGVAPGVKVLPVRVLGKCGGYDSDIIAGMRWAAGLTVAGIAANANPARVLNMSLGGPDPCSSSYAEAVADVTAAGAVIVVAAGNSSGHALGAPASCAGVVAVAGLRHVGTKVGFSDVGTGVAIAAPGGNCVNATGECLYPILSTTNAGTTTPVAASAAYTNGTNYAVGTSFSAPLVSGTVALMLSANANLTPAQVISMLKTSARAFPTSGGTTGISACHAPTGVDQLECYCTTSTCGAGMLNTTAAVQAAVAAGTTTTGVDARITVSPAVPDPGVSVTLSSATTALGTGRSIASRTWSITDGGGIVSGFTGNATDPSITVLPTAVGQFTVHLIVTDDQGMSDAADLTVNVDALNVSMSHATDAPVAGQSVALAAANLSLSSGRSVTTYGWSVTQGTDTVARITGDATGATATLLPLAAGTFTVQLTVTDDLGKQASATWTGTVTAAPTTATTTPTDSGGDSGGGAMGLLELLTAAAAMALAAVTLHRTRKPARVRANARRSGR